MALFYLITSLTTKAPSENEAEAIVEKQQQKEDTVSGSMARFVHASLFVVAAVARSKPKSAPKITEPDDSSESTFEVHFAPGPLGMKLEPITLVQEGKSVLQMGCHVLGFSASKINQARDSGKIKPGDIIVEIDGQNVDGCKYSQSIALLKKPRMSSNGEPIGRSIKFRRSSADDQSSVEDEEEAYTVEFNSSKPLGMILEPITETMGCHVLNFSASKVNQARDSRKIQPGDIIVEIDGQSVEGSEYANTIAMLKRPTANQDKVPASRLIKFRRPLSDIEDSDDDAEEIYSVEFNFSKPLGMVLDPVTATGTSKGNRKECGCCVADFSKSGKSQAFELGVISIGDIVVAIDGVDVSSKDYPYASIISLLKKKAGGRRKNKKKTITFRRVIS